MLSDPDACGVAMSSSSWGILTNTTGEPVGPCRKTILVLDEEDAEIGLRDMVQESCRAGCTDRIALVSTQS